MTALSRSEMLREDLPVDRAMLEVGGEWIANHNADPAEIAEQALAVGARALYYGGKDLSFLPDLPDLEFLSLGDCGDITPAMSLPRLRYFSVISWKGSIDASAWPTLERFAASEPPKGGGGVETVYTHPRVETLAFGRFGEPDLTAISAPRLRELHLAGSKLEALRGIEQLQGLELLVLLRVPKLKSLAGVENLRNLAVLSIDGARQVTTLEHVAQIPRLRLLDIGDQRGIESLGPLAGHPTLEFVLHERTVDMSLEALFHLPRLKGVAGYRSRNWDRDPEELPSLVTRPDDDPVRMAYFELRHRY